MSNDTQVLDQNPVPPPVSNNPFQHQGSLNKEQARIGSDLSEFVRPSGPEVSPSLPQEVSESGVQVETDKPDLTSAHKQVGLEHSGATVPVPTSPTGLVQIPEKKDINSSGTWLDALTEKIQKVMKLMGI